MSARTTSLPRPSAVGSADQFVGLFNSAASRAGGLLENTADAGLYDAHYAAFASLNRAAARPTASTRPQRSRAASMARPRCVCVVRVTAGAVVSAVGAQL